jgi:competence ComEA-like helix-hairpin-helix protein
MRNRASILVGLLWCVVLLSLVVVGVLHTARMDLLTGKNYGDKIQARYLALAGVEKAKALLYKDAEDRSHSGKNHTGELYDAAAQFKEVEFGRGTFSVLRRARPDEGGGVLYGIADEESRINLNTADADMLAKLQGMTPELSTAILAWRGQGNIAGENEYYLSLHPPYKARGAQFETLRELLMVRGMSPDLLLGRDVHQNGLLDSENATADDFGWAEDLTVDSSVKNVSATGQDRVNVQSTDEAALTAVHGITAQIARAIVSYRGQHQFQSIADLLDVTPPQNNQNGRGGRGGQNNSNQTSDDASGATVIDENLLAEIADDVTVGSSDNQAGAVNINTACVDVLICLPGIDRDLAQAIVQYRKSSGFFDNTAGLLKVDGMTREIFKQVAPLVTARSETFRILSEGKVKSTGAQQRLQVIVRVNLDGVKTLSYREDDL